MWPRKSGSTSQKRIFGQTLGSAGVGPGPYFVLPFLGPSTVRDAVARPFDLAANPFTWADDGEVRATALGLQVIDYRADLMDTEEAAEGITEDEYILVRNAYLDQRQFDVTDGEAIDDYEVE